MGELLVGALIVTWLGCLAVVVPETRLRRPVAIAQHIVRWARHSDTRLLVHGFSTLAIAALVAVLYAWIFPGDAVRAARWASGTLQLVGVGITAFGLNGRRVQAGGRKLLDMFRSSLRLLILGRQTGSGYAIMAEPGRLSIEGHPASLGIEPSEEASDREWIHHLRRQLVQVRGEVTAAEKRAADRIRTARAEIDAKLDDLGRELADSEERSRDLAVGGVPIEALGLSLIAAGVTFATWPGLVADLWWLILGR